jgi:hypothetical protein
MKRIKITTENAEIRYSNWISTLIDLMKPTNLYLYAGRGTAKSTDILAKRLVDVIYDMPGAPFAFVADTYVNLITNILPHVFIGLDRNKFFENYHYVVEKRPPENWDKSIVRTYDFKHTMSTFNGCKFFLKSLDRPSINAGISVVHQFGDESKYLQQDKLAKFFPTLRGDLIRFGKSHYYLGQTFCSDMPDPNVGESDWMDKMAARMNKKQVLIILQAARVINDINLELYQAEINQDDRNVVLLKKQLERWSERISSVRRNSTFFYIVSSFANADILTLQYFENLLSGDFDDFKLHVLSIKRTLEAGMLFYGSLQDKHFYKDGYDYDYYDAQGIKANISNTCKGLRYLQTDRPIEAGFDSGNMMSLVFGQEQGAYYRVLKSMFTLAPDWIRELANQFLTYFAPHSKKYLLLYHDRASSQYSKAKKDFANQLKHEIEYNAAGVRTGWVVQLMSTGQGNIFHPDKFNLMNIMMGEKDKRLPKLLIDQWECKELKTQLEITPTKKGPKGEILKEKKSDKLTVSRLPLESTNLTDAFDYLICRKKWLAIAMQKRTVTFSSLDIK